MSGFTTVALLAGLGVIFLLVVALLVWQEAKSRLSSQPTTYVISDAVQYIWSELLPEHRSQLSRSGLRRIIEWEVHYLQGLAQKTRSQAVDVFAGGTPLAVEYIQTKIIETHRVSYSSELIQAVLRLEAGYLASIGAIGSPVENQAGLGDSSNPSNVNREAK